MARKRLQAKSTCRHGERVAIRATDFPDDPSFPQSTEGLKTTVAPALEADATLGRSIRAANLWLRERMVRGENRYTAAWDIVVLPGAKSLVRLTLGDEMTEASADIADESDLQVSLENLQDDLWSRKMRVLGERLVLSEVGD